MTISLSSDKGGFIGRMIPLFRSLISIPAGITRMPLWKFGILTAGRSLTIRHGRADRCGRSSDELNA